MNVALLESSLLQVQHILASICEDICKELDSLRLRVQGISESQHDIVCMGTCHQLAKML